MSKSNISGATGAGGNTSLWHIYTNPDLQGGEASGSRDRVLPDNPRSKCTNCFSVLSGAWCGKLEKCPKVPDDLLA